MAGENLTRIEADERAAILQTESYEVKLDLTTGEKTFLSETTVAFTATPGASSFIDLIAPEVLSITLNGDRLEVSEVFHDSRIQLPNLAAENTLTVVANAAYMNTGEGLHRFVDPVDGEVYLYSQFEVPDSRRMFTVFEQPNLKATFQFTVRAPEYWQVISNQPTPEPTSLGDGTARWEFEPTPRMSSYITALIAGPYGVVRSELTSTDGRTIPLGVFARKSLMEFLDAEYIFEKTRQGFAFFEEIFDYPYPFDKYDQLFVPEYNMGAMENAGAVTFTETYVFRSKVTDAIKERRVVTILHELAHMWFGDLVTMDWWNDLWLNESFAEYMSTLATAEATEWNQAWTTFAAMEKTWAYQQDQLPSTHPIVANIRDLDDVLVNFDGITYAKGGSVLKLLVAWVGRDNFFKGVAQYFKKFAWQNTVLTDLLTELEATSGRDLTDWSARWLETAGVNTLRSNITEVDGVITSFSIEQTATKDYPTIRPHRMALGCYDLQDGALIRTNLLELDIVSESTDVPELVGQRRSDLILLNDGDLTYAKIRLDEHSQATAIKHLDLIRDPLARAVAWGALWDATRDAEMPATDYIELVLSNIAAETESTTLRTTLNQLITAAGSYVRPEYREEATITIADHLWKFAQSAEPGSDAQFQFIKYLALTATTEKQLQILNDLRSGTITLQGLEIDTDLSWELFEGLATAGLVDDEDIAKVLASDNTSTGQQAAARARASLPGTDHKVAIFEELATNANHPNVIVRALGVGLNRTRNHHDLNAVVEPYFASIEEVWKSRSYHISSTILELGYPRQLNNNNLVERTREWLDQADDAVPALKRILIENLAGIERALRAQAADAKAYGTVQE